MLKFIFGCSIYFWIAGVGCFEQLYARSQVVADNRFRENADIVVFRELFQGIFGGRPLPELELFAHCLPASLEWDCF